MAKTTGAQLFAEMMQGYGVTHIFYVPDVHAESARRDGGHGHPPRRHARREGRGVHGGRLRARASGKPGVCMAQTSARPTSPPGCAMPTWRARRSSRSPAARRRSRAIATRTRRSRTSRSSTPVTKANMHVDRVERLPDLLRQAFRAATAARRGRCTCASRATPARCSSEADSTRSSRSASRASRPSGPSPSRSACAAALECSRKREEADHRRRRRRDLLRRASRGRQAGREAADPGRDFAQRQGHHPRRRIRWPSACPAPTRAGAPTARLRSRPRLLHRQPHRRPGDQQLADPAARHRRSIQLDIDPTSWAATIRNKVSLLGDAKVDAARSSSTRRSRRPRDQAWVGRVQELVAEWRAETEPMRNSDAVPIRPERICKEITECCRANGVVVSDTGHAGIWTRQMIELKQPGQRYIRCAGSLGWGFPARSA